MVNALMAADDECPLWRLITNSHDGPIVVEMSILVVMLGAVMMTMVVSIGAMANGAYEFSHGEMVTFPMVV